MRRGYWFGFTAAIAIAAISACGGDETPTPSATEGIRVGGFDFPESELLAEMYAQVIEATGVPVVRLGAIGPREVVDPALQLGLIDVVPEYLGTALQFAGADEPDADTASALAELNVRVAGRGLVALEPAPAEDKNVVVVGAEVATRLDLVRVSDLEPFAPGMRFGGPPECPDRALCLAGLEEVYGLRFEEFVPQRSLTFTAEALRRGEIDVGMMFSTSAELVDADLLILDDDRRLQPAENIVPVVRLDAVERWGDGVVDALNAMSRELTTRALRILNVHAGTGEAVETVAAQWLMSRGLLG